MRFLQSGPWKAKLAPEQKHTRALGEYVYVPLFSKFSNES